MMKRLLVLLSVYVGACAVTAACSSGNAPAEKKPKAITYEVPTPAPVEIFWIDSAGNLGLRGVNAVVPGIPEAGAKLGDACRASATANGKGTVTVCLEPSVGKAIRGQLDLDEWTEHGP